MVKEKYDEIYRVVTGLLMNCESYFEWRSADGFKDMEDLRLVMDSLQQVKELVDKVSQKLGDRDDS